MIKPEPAPPTEKIFNDPSLFHKLLGRSDEPDFLKLIEKANEDYLYWDRFKQIWSLPDIPAEEAWAYLIFMRTVKMKSIPLKSREGKPFWYWVPDSFLRALHQMDQNAAGTILVEDPEAHAGAREQFVISSLMEEAIASSQLEGAATTRDVAKEMLRTGRKPKNTAERMILNNYVTMKALKKYIKEPLSRKMILEIHTLLSKDTHSDKSIAGRFRRNDEEVRVIWNDGTVLHVPPPADELEERMAALCEFANTEDHHFIHPAIKGMILHFWLAYDHPFADGNGRTARALFYWYMLKKRYWLMEYMSISRVIKTAPAKYAKAYLYSESAGEDLTYFLNYHLNVIERAMAEFQGYVRYKAEEAREAKVKISMVEDLNNRQSQLLYKMLTEPEAAMTIQRHRNTFGTTYETARTDLLSLAKRGYLRQHRKGKQFVYTVTDKLKRKAGLEK
ncbi:MAG TPA: Fic family protein [Verrucomicrobiae bacterium]|jgi:Fic family protein|nr:Fic family protein [Verrucomicrobiae bacterium]